MPASRAEIERKHALSRNDVPCAGTDRDLPHRADTVGVRSRDALDREDNLGGTRECVGARVHDRGAGMVGAAAKCHARVVDTDDVTHDTEGAPGVGETRALLDV